MVYNLYLEASLSNSKRFDRSVHGMIGSEQPRPTVWLLVSTVVSCFKMSRRVLKAWAQEAAVICH